MTPVAFCDRESDLARMTILRDGDRLVARRRIPEDAIVATHQVGAFNDLWVHVRSNGRYIRHDKVLDLETGTPCYDYSSMSDGRLWLRAISAWSEIVDGKPRFVPLEESW